ncbi:hypothetical protein ACQKGL_02140 [Ensifer adhaerens]|uniref:hypothetical protein n=1 Tax=Ensifer adhaerens TaxID=106592 RepID=UPI003D026AF7
MEINLPLGAWCPDLADLDNPGVTVAHNVIPNFGNTQGGVTYEPLKEASLYQATTMASRPLGTAIGRDKLQNAKVYGGCATALYKINSGTRLWQNISRTGGYSTSEGERWESTEYGNGIYFTNYNDEMQYINKDIDLQFANVTAVIKGRHIATIRDRIVLANTYDAVDSAVPFRVRWSGIGLPLSWDFSQSTGADFQDVYGFGAIQGIVGGEDGWLIMQDGIVKMSQVPYPMWFEFVPVRNAKGCSVAQSIITVEGRTYFISDDGFYVLDGDRGTSPIGAGKVDKFFLDTVDVGQYHKMSVAADPREKLIYWSFVSKAASNDDPDIMLIYNYVTGNWSKADATAHMIFNSMSLPWSVDMLSTFGSIDNVPASFDSPVWAGGNAMLWAMKKDGSIYVFGGDNLPAVIETREQLVASLFKQDPNFRGDKATIQKMRPLFDGGGASVTMRIGSRANSNGDVRWSNVFPLHPETQWAYSRVCDRFHRFRVELSGPWKNVGILEIDAIPAGSR